MAGLVAHRFDLVCLLLLFSDQFLSKQTWVLRNSSGSVKYFLNSGLVVISGVMNRGALQTIPPPQVDISEKERNNYFAL